MSFTNKYADIIINEPSIQARVARTHRSVLHLLKNNNKDEISLYFGVCLIIGCCAKAYGTNIIFNGQGNILLLSQLLFH